MPPRPHSIYAPVWQTFNGINDRAAFGDVASMQIYTNRFDFMMNLWVKKLRVCVSNEMMLRYYLIDHCGIVPRPLDLYFRRIRGRVHTFVSLFLFIFHFFLTHIFFLFVADGTIANLDRPNSKYGKGAEIADNILKYYAYSDNVTNTTQLQKYPLSFYRKFC